MKKRSVFQKRALTDIAGHDFYIQEAHMAAEVGDMAPDFTLRSHTGDDVTLSQYRGQKNVVLQFHVMSFTGG